MIRYHYCSLHLRRGHQHTTVYSYPLERVLRGLAGGTLNLSLVDIRPGSRSTLQ
jgi:hypothetical protein